jgi:putative Holliday junction resolvase
MNKGKILAIDFGEKILGLAVSDSNRSFSFPLKNYSRKNLNDDILFLKNLIDEKEIKLIIFGNPINSKGAEGIMSKKVKDFAEKFKKAIDIPIVFFDESFTTKQAEYILRDYGLNQKKMKGKKDAIAASFILSSYLEYIND